MSIFFVSTLSFAHGKEEIIDNFDTGLVTNVSGNKQAKSSTPNVRNFYIDKKIGSLVKTILCHGACPRILNFSKQKPKVKF